MDAGETTHVPLEAVEASANQISRTTRTGTAKMGST